MEKISFTAAGKTATLYRCSSAGQPLIVFHHYTGDGDGIFRALEQRNAPACNLLVIGNLQWNHDMSPWPCPPIRTKEPLFTGGADAYLNVLLTEILPQAEKMIIGIPSFLGIAGYSMAGLFALYAMQQTDVFDRGASISGSLWFPEFQSYVLQHDFPKQPERLYLSLGDRESKTGNPYLKTVQQSTEELAAHYRQMGIDVIWELNPGNHFRDAEERTAKGIAGILTLSNSTV